MMMAFALLVSAALGCLAPPGRRTTRERIKYAVWSFALFLGIALGVAWLMYPFSR
jgi:hypothetical protein